MSLTLPFYKLLKEAKEVKKTNDDSISLNKFVSSTGLCSRRQADKWIEQGRVTINGEIAQLGNRVFPKDIIKVDGETVRKKKKAIYIAFNKPVGVVCTTEHSEPNNIVDYINHRERLFPIGRLDKPSQGLIFLTNDGDIVNKILRAGNSHEKEYLVTVRQPIVPAFVEKMRSGVQLEETVTKKCKVTQINNFIFKITLTQGLNRQIRRMCQALGYNVTQLIRTRIMNVRVNTLKVGQWRELTAAEMEEINKMIADSSKTEEASEDSNKRAAKTNRKKPYFKPDNQDTSSKSTPKKKRFSTSASDSKKKKKGTDKIKPTAKRRRNKMKSKKKNLE